jgi:hypothetical protein
LGRPGNEGTTSMHVDRASKIKKGFGEGGRPGRESAACRWESVPRAGGESTRDASDDSLNHRGHGGDSSPFSPHAHPGPPPPRGGRGNTGSGTHT